MNNGVRLEYRGHTVLTSKADKKLQPFCIEPNYKVCYITFRRQ